MRSFHFESINETILKYETFPTSTLDSKYDSARENPTKNNLCMQKIKHEGDMRGNQESKHFKPLFMGARVFIQATKKGDAFFVYVNSTLILGCNNMRSLFNTKTTKIFLKRKNRQIT
jgi:hypothetical protein